MLTQDQIEAIKAPFPPEALSSDTSRGFELTSIKAAQAPAVIERLNEVFGLCGVGWRYVHSPFEELHTDNGRVEIVIETRSPSIMLNPPTRDKRIDIDVPPVPHPAAGAHWRDPEWAGGGIPAVDAQLTLCSQSATITSRFRR